MGGSKAPKPDKNIGRAAMKSAELGEEVFAWMKDQAEVTNQWAAEDRDRWTNTFIPLQDAYIEEAQNWDSQERKDTVAGQAIADTRLQANIADGTRLRQAMAQGVNPNSGRFQSASAKGATDTALAAAGAGNLARRQVEAEAEGKMANAINLGSGLGVNPATSMSLSNSAYTGGGSAAMSGYGQQGSLLNQQFQNQMASYNASQSAMGSMFGAIGSVAGLVSSKEAKTDKKKVRDGVSLGAVRELPIESWKYKPGIADGGDQTHIGTYAEDFTKATGQGDGKTIDISSAIGITMGAIKDLDAKVSKLEQRAA